MRPMLLGCTLLSCIGVALVASGCGKQQTILQQDQAQFPQAVRLFQQTGCVTCHGDDLQGGIGPNLQHVGSRLTVEQIQRQIEHGGAPMPGYGSNGQGILTDSQIGTLAQWLSQKK